MKRRTSIFAPIGQVFKRKGRFAAGRGDGWSEAIPIIASQDKIDGYLGVYHRAGQEPGPGGSTHPTQDAATSRGVITDV